MGRSSALQRQISARVRTAIDDSDYSPTRVAELTGIARETLRRRLGDVGVSFTLDELELIAEVLDLPCDVFVDSSVWRATRKAAS